jgi:hypothetical protein
MCLSSESVISIDIIDSNWTILVKILRMSYNLKHLQLPSFYNVYQKAVVLNCEAGTTHETLSVGFENFVWWKIFEKYSSSSEVIIYEIEKQ